MKTIGIFYGSSTGNTQDAAKIIAQKLGTENVFDVGNVSTDQLAKYDVLIFGSSTWGIGDLQDDWEGFISQVKAQNLSGKIVAVFGCGDSSSYADSFCDAIGIIAKTANAAGAEIIGKVDTSNYSYDDSQAVENGKFLGLALDIENEDDKTNSRINAWIEQLKREAKL